MKAVLKYHHKALIHYRFTLELVVYEIGRSSRYPNGIKYRLICIDQSTRKKVLMDNHYPKGDHIHINDQEISYNYVSEEKLIEDFKKLVLDKMEIKI